MTRDQILDFLYLRKVVWQAKRADATDTAEADARLARINANIARIRDAPDTAFTTRTVPRAGLRRLLGR